MTTDIKQNRLSINDYGRTLAHYGVDLAYPRNGAIAFLSAGFGWLAHANFVTYGPGLVAGMLSGPFGQGFFGYYFGTYVAAPAAVKEIMPYLAIQVTIGATIAASTTLNIIAMAFFGIRNKLQQLRSPNARPLLPVNRIDRPVKNQESSVLGTGASSKAVEKTAPLPTRIQRTPGIEKIEGNSTMSDLLGIDPTDSSDCCWNLCP